MRRQGDPHQRAGGLLADLFRREVHGESPSTAILAPRELRRAFKSSESSFANETVVVAVLIPVVFRINTTPIVPVARRVGVSARVKPRIIL